MLYPIENEVRQVRDLSGIWRLKLDPDEIGLHKIPEVIFSEEYQVEYLRENHKAFDACDFLIGEQVWKFAIS